MCRCTRYFKVIGNVSPKKLQRTRSSFDISKDVVEHREQNNNSFVRAGAEDLYVHIEQVER